MAPSLFRHPRERIMLLQLARKLGLALSLALALVVATSAGVVHAQDGTATLVLDFGDGRVETICVPLDSGVATGADLLQASGLTVGLESSGMGVLVCQIDGVGCEPGKERCWCQCQSTPCIYWSFFIAANGQWTYSNLGASAVQVSDGMVHGWVWGDGKAAPNVEPLSACEAEDTPAEDMPEPTAGATIDTATTVSATTEPTPQGTPAAAPASPCASLGLMVLPALMAGLVLTRRR
jgi:hypothetical protein